MSTYQFPKEVAAALRGHRNNQADIDGLTGLAWILSGNALFVWNYHDGQRATVHSHALPYALSGQCHVSVIQHQVYKSPSVTQLVVEDILQVCTAACCGQHVHGMWASHLHSD